MLSLLHFMHLIIISPLSPLPPTPLLLLLSSSLSSLPPSPHPPSHQAHSIHPHPSYNLSLRFMLAPEHDLAMVRLLKPAQLSSSVRPACLPATLQDPPAGTLCTVSGWGHLMFKHGPSPSLLHHTDVPLVSYR